jgi:hypothetical protein
MILGFGAEPSNFDVPCDSHEIPQISTIDRAFGPVFSSNCEIVFAEWSKPAT